MRILKRLSIQNFQSHDDTDITFDEGINAITGQSDVGKSSSFRALRWNLYNNMVGFFFRRMPLKRGDATEVTTEFDDVTVTRSRGNSHNTYQVNDDDVLDTVRTDVPEEVEEAVNLADYNMQQQHDKYFLIQDSPGVVAKKLNHIVGLDIIDSSQKRVNAIHKKANRDSEYEAERVIDLKKKLKDMVYIDKLEKLGNRINKDLIERDSLRKERVALVSLVDDLNKVEESIEASEEWLKIKDDSQELRDTVSELQRDINKLQGIQNLVDKVQLIDKEIAQSEALLDVKKDARAVWAIKEERRKLSEIVTGIQSIVIQIKQGDDKVEALKEQKQSLIKEIDSCPVCHVPITTGAHRQLVIDYFEEN